MTQPSAAAAAEYVRAAAFRRLRSFLRVVGLARRLPTRAVPSLIEAAAVGRYMNK